MEVIKLTMVEFHFAGTAGVMNGGSHPVTLSWLIGMPQKDTDIVNIIFNTLSYFSYFLAFREIVELHFGG